MENELDTDLCAICADERQYLPLDGQHWTTLAERAEQGCRIDVEELEADLFGLTARPKADIGQTALLVCTGAGNLLWDVPGFIDDAAVAAVGELGGIAAIMASHPHMYGVQLEWARAFGATVWISEKDRGWVRRDGRQGAEGVLRAERGQFSLGRDRRRGQRGDAESHGRHAA